MLSKELQIGKAGEHLVCCDLIMQGYNAFLADQGSPFDVLVEKDGILKRIQVKSTMALKTYNKANNIYRFGTRSGTSGSPHVTKDAEVDCYAFVALDIKTIAYIPISEMLSRSGKVKTTVDFKSKRISYKGRIYQNGTRRTPDWGKCIEDFGNFSEAMKHEI